MRTFEVNILIYLPKNCSFSILWGVDILSTSTVYSGFVCESIVFLLKINKSLIDIFLLSTLQEQLIICLSPDCSREQSLLIPTRNA